MVLPFEREHSFQVFRVFALEASLEAFLEVVLKPQNELKIDLKIYLKTMPSSKLR